MRRRFRILESLIALALLSVAAAFPAVAGIAEFNDAMRKGDVKAASAEAVEIWKTWDTQDSDTALMAREFGFVSMLAGDHDAARNFGRFLMESGAALPVPDDSPLTSAVLYRAADHRLETTSSTRQALLEALQARGALDGIDLITVTGAEILYAGDWAAGDWSGLGESSPIAIELLTRGQTSLLPRRRRAELVAAAGNFMSQGKNLTKSRNDTYDVMADVHDSIVGDIDGDAAGALRGQLWPLKWESQAWALAIASFLTSDYAQIDSLISTKIEPRALRSVKTAYVAEDPQVAGLRECEGSFEGRKIRYPSNRAYAGMVGAVLVRAETDAEGKVVETEVLSAVPVASFSDVVIKAVQTWRFEPDRDADLGKCRLKSRNHVISVVFRIY